MEVYKKVFNKTGITEAIHRRSKEIEIRVANLTNSKQYNKFAKEFSAKLAKKGLSKQKGLWKQFYKTAKKLNLGILPDTYTQFEKQIMEKAIVHNFKMIKSIPQEVLEIYKHKYTTMLIEEIAVGRISRGSFEKQLREHGHKHAKVVARTEASKLQTTILQNRATDLGSVCYQWLSSNDKRTRPSHRRMNGVIVFWRDKDDEKPNLDNMFGNAGEFPNCRCSPEPIFDIDDLDKVMYTVYDYKTKSFETMTRQKLLERIEEERIS